MPFLLQHSYSTQCTCIYSSVDVIIELLLSELLLSSCRRNDSDISEEILKSANTSLEHSGYTLTSGRIISGQEEAVGGWITGNFLSQSLEKSVRLYHHR